MKSRALVIVGTLTAVLPCLGAAEGSSPTATMGLEPLVRGKEAMVARLLKDSTLVRQLESSDNQEVRALLAEARSLHHDAIQAIGAGSPESANAALDLAMQKIQRARKLLPPETGGDEQRSRIDALGKSIEALRHSYRQRLAGAPGVAADDALLRELDANVLRAHRELADGHSGAALQTLQGAERSLTGGLLGKIGASTVEYRREGLSPAEEFREELARNQSYADLVPVAIEQLHPPEDTVQRLRRQLERNRELRERTTAQAAKDPAGAAEALQAGTRAIEDALQGAGLSVTRVSHE